MLNNSIKYTFSTIQHTRFCIVGGGSGGVNIVGQLLRRKGVKHSDVKVFEPSKLHFYQPGWTMVAGCIYDPKLTVRATREVIDPNVAIVEQSVTKINPEKNELITEDGTKWTYDQLIISTGVKCDYSLIKGCQEALNDPNCPVGSAYWVKYAEKFQKLAKEFKGGNAVFTEPVFPIKCGGAPQKVLYLIEDLLIKKGLRSKTNITFYKSVDFVFPVPKYSMALAEILKERKVPVNFKHSLIEIKGKERVAIFQNLATNKTVEVNFDLLHVVPPHRPPVFIKESGLSDANGYVNVNSKTLQHIQYNNIWALGDSSNLPTSKTVAALLSQTPILLDNLMYSINNKGSKQFPESYDGYTSCPILIGRNKLMLCEFKYNQEVDESFFINQAKPNRLFFHLKKDFFPWVYWNLIPKGMWYGKQSIFPHFTRALIN